MIATSTKPLVSVIIPTYKSRGGLKRSIDSVLNQTYVNYEIIIVDDNDSNTIFRKETEKIMSEYDKYTNVVYIKHKVNSNGAVARNTGISHAKGEYIAFLDDDDEWMPCKLDKQMEFLTSHNEYECVYCFINIGDKKEPCLAHEGNAIVPLLMNRTKMYTSALLFRSNAIKSINGFDETFKRHQDYELMVRFFLNGYKIGCLKEYMVRIGSLGGNGLNGEAFINLKRQFLSTFEKPLNQLDTRNKGIKNKIIASNYVSVCDTLISGKHFKLAFNLLKDCFITSPSATISQIFFLSKEHVLRKL